MSWIPWVAWAAAVVIGAVVLGFCAYEIVWKARRLQADLTRLQVVQLGAVQLSAELTAAADRLGRTGLLRS